MSFPATVGELKTNILDMQVGDYIGIGARWYSGWELPELLSFGTSIYSELPINGVGARPSSIITGTFYMVKVDKGLLISDRLIVNNISFHTLNNYKLIQGKPIYPMFSDNSFPKSIKSAICRSITGGSAYLDEYNNSSSVNKNKGAWPSNNEWDKYVVNFQIDKIQEGKSLDNVWNCNGDIQTFCQDTIIDGVILPDNSISTSNHRTVRGYLSINGVNAGISNGNWTFVGFRPVIEFEE